MKRLGLFIAAAFLLFAPAAQAANSTVSAMTAASALGGTELLYVVQGAADRKGTPAQFATYIYGLASGDCTISGIGAVVCTKTNGTAFTALATTAPGTGVATFLATPSSANLLAALTTSTGTGVNVFGTAPTISSPTINTAATLGFITGSTQCLQVNTSGVVSGTGAVCGGSGSSGANPTATASDTAVNGVATTFMRSDGAPAIQKTSASQFGLVKVDGTSITAAAGVISATGAVASVSSGIGITCSPTTGAVVCSAPATVRNNTATSDTITSTDKGTTVTESNAASVAVAITTAGFVSTDYFTVKNLGAGVATYTPSSGTIDGAGTLVCSQNQSADLYFDGTNYKTLAKTCGLGALATTTPGANVATAAAVALSGAGGLTSTIASGTAALGTTAIASGACATVVTVSATNVATTDVVYFGYNSDPTAVTGYGASASGAVLSIYPYPTANNVNVKVCNSSSGSITPGSMTLNWRVLR